MGQNNSKLPIVAEEKESVLASDDEVIASTECGQIIGKKYSFEGIQQTANVFLGIPFARPPIDQLRFRKPEPPEPWTGIRQAKNFQAQCPQVGWHPLFNKITGTVNSEDCLYLNVFAPTSDVSNGTPKSDWKLLPVIVFIHGGAFVLGSAKQYGFKGICKNFVLENQVVFVTVQYRVGPLGFFSTGDEACDDNCGLWDMTMALRWIQQNIGHFGGDKHNVTVMGQSAGGASADLLALSPHSRDLFHKVIPMGGNGNCEFALHDNAVDKCRETAQQLGVYTTNSEELIAQLRKMPSEKLTLGFSMRGKKAVGPFQGFKCPLAPRFDGKFFPKPLAELRKEAPLKPKLVGVTQMESLVFLLLGMDHRSLAKLQETIALLLPEKEYPNNFKQLREEAMRIYIKGDIGKYLNDETAMIKINAEFLSDRFAGIAVQQQALDQLALGNGQNTFLYSFDHCNPKFWSVYEIVYLKRIKNSWKNTCSHGLELFYFFRGDLRMFGRNVMDQQDMKTVMLVTKMWSNFAKYGNPNGSPNEPASLFAGFKWEPVSEEKPSQYLSIKPEPEMKEQFQDGRPLHWIQLVKSKF